MNNNPNYNNLKVLSGSPIQVHPKIILYQPTLNDIGELGADRFGGIIDIWFLKREQLIEEENDETILMDDFDLWKTIMIYNEFLRNIFKDSIMFFIHRNVEFLPTSRSLFIGELDSGIELTRDIFEEIQRGIRIITQHSESDDKQYNEKAKFSSRALEIKAQMEAGEAKIRAIKGSNNSENVYANQIAGFVAKSSKSFEEVYAMTIVQFRLALEKIVAIESYTMNILLSPHMDPKKKKPKLTHWLQ